MNHDKSGEAIRISSNNARGAPGADESTKSATLLPMLGIGLFLMIISIIVVVFVFR